MLLHSRHTELFVWPSGIKVSRSHPDGGSGAAAPLFFGWFRCLVGPGAVHLVTIGGDPDIVAEKIAIGGEAFGIPRVISEGLAPIGRPSQSDGGCIVVAAAIVEDQV